ncbi:MAG: DUF839 domain-containing protein [Algibacter sp.]|uniref:alkaline phosphatase PhoX n=1 Tax=Algibacter sp. TaxID=1872428 RepID=UPI0026327F65|nr:alkaline phosphatase PhoX [Algibacter sp.]MDG1730849.1 DUF839 domain-containing protein [Algibacter sp.]MDG2179351.1 DUF839 domain-containing protein [Algibacter sp.]
MKIILQFTLILFILVLQSVNGQDIGDFISITPTTQTSGFVLPSSHDFQSIIKVGDVLTAGGNMLTKPDFTGYVPIAGSSINGYLSVNSEDAPPPFGGGGGVTILDIYFNTTSKLWEKTASQTIDFSSVGGTAANCSGTVTTWGTVISCEEASIPDTFPPFDGYNDLGWNVEINPATKTVVGKHYAMGNFAHENVAIHINERTVYQGADSNPGYLYKFVADTAQDLSSGKLYVFKGLKNGVGSWMLLANSNQAERNSTLTQSGASGLDATIFNGIEDVEIGPDGMIYFAVKGEGRVYRFSDSDILETSASTVIMETYVGGMSYDIDDGTSITSTPWGNGNDNLAFDGEGNLWVLQDGGNGYMWVVKNGHTQASPDVELFGSTPMGSEPTGITFTPDYKFLFMSIQHPNNTNNGNQMDAAGNSVNFNTGTTLVVALKENIGSALAVKDKNRNQSFSIFPNPLKSSRQLTIKGSQIITIKLYSVLGKMLLDNTYNGPNEVELNLKNLNSGIYVLKINESIKSKLIIE